MIRLHFRKSNSIMFRITLQFIILVILPVTLFFTYSFLQLKASIKKEAFYEADLYGQQLQNKINLKVDMAENICNAIAYDNQFVDFLKLNKEFDGNLLNYYSERVNSVVSQVLLLDQSGIESFYVFMNNEKIPEGWGDFWSYNRIKQKEWCKTFLESDDIDCWFNEKQENVFDFLYINSGKPQYRYYARRINDVQGNCLAVIVLEFDLKNFFLSPIDKVTETKKITIRDPEDYILAEFIPHGEEKYELLSSREYQDQKIMIEISKLSTAENITFDYARISLIGMLAGFSVSIIILYLSIRKVFKKLNENLEIVEQAMIAETDMKVPCSSNDELGRIAKSFNSLIEKNRALIKDIVKRETLQKSTQIKALQYQINPHFFYNTLDIIASKMILSGNIETADVVSGFGKMLRYNIGSKTMYTVLSLEIAYVKQYISIQKLRYGDRLKLVINVTEKAMGVEILKFLLQPIVENSILHGMMEEEEMIISIDAYVKEERHLVIAVSDNGAGVEDRLLEQINSNLKRSDYSSYETDSTRASRGIGLENINERLKIFYGEEYGLKMCKNKTRGIKTIIRIPIS